jgi:uncharacterized protein (UPF0335 family)
MTEGAPDLARDQKALRNLVRQIVDLNKRIDALGQERGLLYKMAKRQGVDTKVLRRVIADMRRDLGEVDEEEALSDLYKAWLGVPTRADEKDAYRKLQNAKPWNRPGGPKVLSLGDSYQDETDSDHQTEDDDFDFLR